MSLSSKSTGNNSTMTCMNIEPFIASMKSCWSIFISTICINLSFGRTSEENQSNIVNHLSTNKIATNLPDPTLSREWRNQIYSNGKYVPTSSLINGKKIFNQVPIERNSTQRISIGFINDFTFFMWKFSDIHSFIPLPRSMMWLTVLLQNKSTRMTTDSHFFLPIKIFPCDY